MSPTIQMRGRYTIHQTYLNKGLQYILLFLRKFYQVEIRSLVDVYQAIHLEDQVLFHPFSKLSKKVKNITYQYKLYGTKRTTK